MLVLNFLVELYIFWIINHISRGIFIQNKYLISNNQLN